jgi:serine/threonine protein kinase/tetratricopeptide (TPR) repeat protein
MPDSGSQAGQTISHYQVMERLGAGGMGVVYKALDLNLERTVALKFLPEGATVSAEDKARLLREARAASALDHPNVGIIYGVEESDGQLFISMAYYQGETLSRRLARGVVPVRESLELAIQIASGLAAAHARNIVHRDVKPSNIILTQENLAKIVDFGLARLVATASATLTSSNSGTLPYMSPEQILGETVDQRSDVWALGVILVQLLTASHPFMRESTTAMTFAILNQPPAALDAVPPFLLPIVYHALSKNPAHRYASAKEMLADLESARAQLSSGAAQIVEEPTLTRTGSSRELKQYAERASEPRWDTAKRKRVSRQAIGVGLMVLLLASPLLVPNVRTLVAGLLSGKGEKHIAVLPFDNIGGDASTEAVAEGLMDSMTSQLSNLDAAQQSLWVVPASVVRSKKVEDPATAYRELGANLVVKGSIQRQGTAVQLTVNLIDAKDLRQVGAATLNDAAGDLNTLQSEAVARLAGLMKIHVTEGMLRDTGGNVAPAAYESYLKALGYMQRYDKPGNLDLAIASLNAAVQKDAQFALGYSGLAEAYRLKNKVDPNPKWIDEVSANVNHALALDNRLPSAYVTLGNLHSRLGKDELALQEFQHALQLDPHSVDALRGTAGAYERMGHLAEAEATLKKAVALRPDYWDEYNSLGAFYDAHNRYAEAIAQYEKVIALTPDNAAAYSNMAAAYLDMGDAKVLPKAEAALKKSISLAPSYASYANLGNLYLTEGRYAEAAEITEKALQLNDKDFRIWANLVMARRWLKQDDKAAVATERLTKLMEEAAKEQPEDAEIQSGLAICYIEEKMQEKGLQAISKALALAPENGRVLVDAGEVYADLGERGKALQYLHEGLKKGATMDDLQSRPALQTILSDESFRASGKRD